MDAPTRNLQNIKHKHAGQPDQKRVAPYRIRASLWLVTAPFSELCMYVYARCFVHGYRANRVIKVLVLWS